MRSSRNPDDYLPYIAKNLRLENAAVLILAFNGSGYTRDHGTRCVCCKRELGCGIVYAKVDVRHTGRIPTDRVRRYRLPDRSYAVCLKSEQCLILAGGRAPKYMVPEELILDTIVQGASRAQVGAFKKGYQAGRSGLSHHDPGVFPYKLVGANPLVRRMASFWFDGYAQGQERRVQAHVRDVKRVSDAIGSEQ